MKNMPETTTQACEMSSRKFLETFLVNLTSHRNLHFVTYSKVQYNELVYFSLVSLMLFELTVQKNSPHVTGVTSAATVIVNLELLLQSIRMI